MYRLTVVLLSCLFSLSVGAQTIYIAVASNFIKPTKQIIAKFEQETGHKVNVSFGSSGKLYAQIMHGAPFSLFLSADQDKPQKLVSQGVASKSDVATYAVGQLVLWSAKEEFKGIEHKRLSNKSFDKIAIANPKLAPYGLAAQHFLASYQVKPNQMVIGENINQAFQFVATGNADLGLVAHSQIPKELGGWLIPAELYPAIKQDMVLLNSAKNNQAATLLFDYFQSESSQNVITSFGYKLPLDN